MPSAKSLANLIPYKKGENGHQFGGYNLKERLMHQLYKDRAAKADAFVQSTIEGAILREPTPFKEVWDRVAGKVPDKHDIEVTERIANFIFIMPDGRKLTPKELIEGKDGR